MADSFQDLIRRLSASHDREVSQLQRKLQKYQTENAELRGKLELMQNVVNGAMSMTSTPPQKSQQKFVMPDYDDDDDDMPQPNIPVFQPPPSTKVKAAPKATATGTARKPANNFAQRPTSPRRNAPEPAPRGMAIPDWASMSDASSVSTTPAWLGGPPRAAQPGNRVSSGVGRPQSPRGRSPSPRLTTSPITGNTTNQIQMGAQKSSVPPTVADMVDDFRAHVKQHGAVGIAGIGRKFRICDDDNSGALSAEEFTKALNELGFHYNDDQVQQLIEHFDSDGDGKIEYEEFLVACRPPMNLRRKRIVQKVFEMLDHNKDGVLTTDDIKGNFKPHNDPRVQGRSMSAEQVAHEFLSTFDVIDHNGDVTLEAFIKYYQGVSASVDNDDYFELMLRNGWHMSGGKGWCENTSCLRVLVTTKDGGQSVEEIKNDLGVDKHDYQDLQKRLEKQGITDIADIKLCM